MGQEQYEAIMARLDRLEELIGRASSPVMDARECARYVGVSLGSLYRMTSERKIPHYKMGENRLLFNREEIDRWMMRERVRTRDELRTEAAVRTLGTGRKAARAAGRRG